MAFTPGIVSLVSASSTSVSLQSTLPTGGTAPYTYQWYRTLQNDSNYQPLAGKTALTLTDTAVVSGQVYYYVLVTTDASPLALSGNALEVETIATASVPDHQDNSISSFVTSTVTGKPVQAISNADGTPIAGGAGGSTSAIAHAAAQSFTESSTNPLQGDLTGALKVNVVAGGGAGGGTSSTFTANLPASGTAVGFVDQNGKMQAASVAAFHSGDNTNVAAGGLGLLTGGVTQIKNAIGNLDRQTEAGIDRIPAVGITTGAASYAVPFTVSVPATITGSTTAQTVAPTSMANIFVGTVINYDTATPSVTEPIVVASVTSTTFTAVFKNSHAATAGTAFYFNQARDGAIGDKVAITGLAAGMTYFVNAITGLAEQERSAAGELDGANGTGTAVAAEYEFNGNGPVLSTGFSSGLGFDRARSLQAKGLAVGIVSGTINTNQITAVTAATVNSLQAGQQIRIDRNTATEESAYVSQTYVPGTATINLQSNLAFNHTGAAIEWDVFASAGPGLSGFIATGIGIEEEALYNPVDGKYYIERASTTDAMPSANIVAESGVVWNGTTFDRERAAYQDALSATGIPAEAEMLWNGSTFDRARSVQATDGQGPTGFGADAIMLWNGATYDRLRGVNGALTVSLSNSGTFTDRSGSITTGGTSQALAPVNATRRYLTVENTSTANIAINFTSAASMTSGSIVISPLGSITLSSQSFVSTEAVTVVGATTGQTYVAKEA